MVADGASAGPDAEAPPDAGAAADGGCTASTSGAPGTIACTGVDAPATPDHLLVNFKVPDGVLPPGAPSLTGMVIVSGGKIFAQMPLIPVSTSCATTASCSPGFYAGPLDAQITNDGAPVADLKWTLEPLTPSASLTPGSVVLKYLESSRTSLMALPTSAQASAALTAVVKTESVVNTAASSVVHLADMTGDAGVTHVYVVPDEVKLLDAYLQNASDTAPAGMQPSFDCFLATNGGRSWSDRMVCGGLWIAMVALVPWEAAVAAPVWAGGCVIMLGGVVWSQFEAESASGLPVNAVPSQVTSPVEETNAEIAQGWHATSQGPTPPGAGNNGGVGCQSDSQCSPTFPTCDPQTNTCI